MNKHRIEKLYGIASQFTGGAIIAIFNIPELNGLRKAEYNYENDLAAAGDRIEKQILARKVFER